MTRKSPGCWTMQERASMSTNALPALMHPGAKFPIPSNSEGIRFDFLFCGCKVSAYYFHREEFQDRLFVGFNGAVNRDAEKDPRDVFQRRTWAESIEASSLFISDPTLLRSNTIQIGWGQGSSFTQPLAAMSQCVDFVRQQVDIKSNNSILFFGSSAGGFQAIQAHSRFPGSRFLVNNAQFDWSKYFQKYVDQVLRSSHSGKSVKTLLAEEKSTVNALTRFIEFDLPFSGDYWINTASRIDFSAQLPVVDSFIKDRAKKRTNEGFDFSVHYYFDSKSGHMPMPKDRSLSLINASLSKIPGDE